MVTDAQKLLLVLPLVPLVGSAVTYLHCRNTKRKQAQSGWIATLFSFVAFGVSLRLFGMLPEDEGTIRNTYWNWFIVGDLDVSLSLGLDRLASLMTLIITGVGSLIHMYAIGYMEHDDHRPRFFAYLNLFLFAMLLLVLGDNLLVMFIGWEGVGLCSYLLIGFWFKEMENAKAGQKAFVVNRIGDAGFLLGIFTLFVATGSISFSGIESGIPAANPILLEWAALLLFIGAVGKSAQIPLYVWLPDAMAGPTPVSALIHAATMVTAGVYMCTRMDFLFNYALAPSVMVGILIIGTLTAFVAATIALVQNDIKKVLAYSTVSQLGFMFMAVGSAAHSNAMYHVTTHAFFKACLFMAAGSVIIGCHHEQDMRKFGGLRKSMPWTFITYLIATLAIAGFPYLSGFFSKDLILWSVFSNPEAVAHAPLFGLPIHQLCWGIGLVTAFLTAFYMTRSLMMTFFGEYRGDHDAHESPWVVTVPLVILAVLSAGFGYLYGDAFIRFLESWTRIDLVGGGHAIAEDPVVGSLYVSLEIISAVIAILGIVVAVTFYKFLPALPGKLKALTPYTHKFLSNKWLVDELYAAVIVTPLKRISDVLFKVVDRLIIDGSVNGTGMVVEASGEMARWTQTGRITSYAVSMFVGMFLLVGFYLMMGL